jgi:hypothetical protein
MQLVYVFDAYCGWLNPSPPPSHSFAGFGRPRRTPSAGPQNPAHKQALTLLRQPICVTAKTG